MRERLIGRVLVKELSRKATSTARNEIHGDSSLLLAFLFETIGLPVINLPGTAGGAMPQGLW